MEDYWKVSSDIFSIEKQFFLIQYLLSVNFAYNTSFLSLIGDEILAVNGSILHGLSHGDAISIFKSIRSGPVVLQIARRNAVISSSSGNLAIRQSRSDLRAARFSLSSQPLKENSVINAR